MGKDILKYLRPRSVAPQPLHNHRSSSNQSINLWRILSTCFSPFQEPLPRLERVRRKQLCLSLASSPDGHPRSCFLGTWVVLISICLDWSMVIDRHFRSSPMITNGNLESLLSGLDLHEQGHEWCVEERQHSHIHMLSDDIIFWVNDLLRQRFHLIVESGLLDKTQRFRLNYSYMK